MSKFRVTVATLDMIPAATTEFEVEAKTRFDAEDKAINMAQNGEGEWTDDRGNEVNDVDGNFAVAEGTERID